MGLVLLTAPAEEPVSLADAKLHLRVDHDDDDTLIAGLIVSARQQAELLTGRQLVTAQYRYSLDTWPRHGIFEIPRPSLVSVQSIKYLDADGVLQTVDPADYTVDIFSDPGRIVPEYGEVWPSARLDANAVRVEYTAGYGGAADVPQAIKTWMHLAIAAWYAQREAIITGTIVAELPRGLWLGLLDAYTVTRF